MKTYTLAFIALHSEQIPDFCEKHSIDKDKIVEVRSDFVIPSVEMLDTEGNEYTGYIGAPVMRLPPNISAIDFLSSEVEAVTIVAFVKLDEDFDVFAIEVNLRIIQGAGGKDLFMEFFGPLGDNNELLHDFSLDPIFIEDHYGNKVQFAGVSFSKTELEKEHESD